MERLVYAHTQGLCPVCRRKVQARIVRAGSSVEMEKFCPDHGLSSVMVSSDAAWYEASRDYAKPAQEPLAWSMKEYRGCPDSCGLCPEHQQHTCLPVVEITGKCDLECPVCLKRREAILELSLDDFCGVLDTLFHAEGKVDVLNLSGGEPAMHPRLPEFLETAAARGVLQTTVSTNGRALARNKRLRDAFRRTGAVASLQFDGFQALTYQVLRGMDLAAEKLALIRTLEEEGVKYSLVATVAAGINDREIPAIVDFFFECKALSLMFQPVCFTGAAAAMAGTGKRFTIADVVREAGKSRHARSEDFNPLPCSHPSCFALSYYFMVEAGSYVSLKELLGRERFLQAIANRTLPGLDREGLTLFKERLYELWSAADVDGVNEKAIARMKHILQAMNQTQFDPRTVIDLGFESVKSIFIHHFMDAESFDMARLVKCCNVYPQKDGRLVPICAQNVFVQEKEVV